VSITLGDANAISGGIHVANTTNIQNTYIQEREKSEDELEQEKRIKFKSLCEKVYEDGILENYEIVQLEDERVKLGLDKDIANQILEQTRQLSLKRKSEIAARDAITMKIINMQIQKNDIVQIKAQFPKLEAMHDIYKNDVVDCTYYMLLSTLYPIRYIDLYEKSRADDYWMAFWVYIAYLKEAEIAKAERALSKLSWFTRYPESNDLLLSALNSNMEFGPDIAKDYLSIVEAEPCSPELASFYHALLYEVNLQKAQECGVKQNEIAYYLDAIIHMEDPRAKAAAREKEKTEKIEAIGNQYLKIVEEYGTSKKARDIFKHQISDLKEKIWEDCKRIKKEFGETSPEYQEIHEADNAISFASRFGHGNLWGLRKSIKDSPYAIKLIDDAIIRFVDAEMQSGKEDARRDFRQEEISKEKERKEKEQQEIEYEVENRKRLESKEYRDSRAPLLGEAYKRINAVEREKYKEKSPNPVDEKCKKQVYNLWDYYSQLSMKHSMFTQCGHDYHVAWEAIKEARGLGFEDLWSIRKNINNLVVEERVDFLLEALIKQECDKNDEFKVWFEEKEKEFEAEREEREKAEAKKKELEHARELEVKLEAEKKEKEQDEVETKTMVRKSLRFNIDSLSDTELDFLGLIKRAKSRLAAKVTANPEDKEARDAYDRVRDAYRTFLKERDVTTFLEMVKDCPLAIETIEQCAPRFK